MEIDIFQKLTNSLKICSKFANLGEKLKKNPNLKSLFINQPIFIKKFQDLVGAHSEAKAKFYEYLRSADFFHILNELFFIVPQLCRQNLISKSCLDKAIIAIKSFQSLKIEPAAYLLNDLEMQDFNDFLQEMNYAKVELQSSKSVEKAIEVEIEQLEEKINTSDKTQINLDYKINMLMTANNFLQNEVKNADKYDALQKNLLEKLDKNEYFEDDSIEDPHEKLSEQEIKEIMKELKSYVKINYFVFYEEKFSSFMTSLESNIELSPIFHIHFFKINKKRKSGFLKTVINTLFEPKYIYLGIDLIFFRSILQTEKENKNFIYIISSFGNHKFAQEDIKFMNDVFLQKEARVLFFLINEDERHQLLKPEDFYFEFEKCKQKELIQTFKNIFQSPSKNSRSYNELKLRLEKATLRKKRCSDNMKYLEAVSKNKNKFLNELEGIEIAKLQTLKEENDVKRKNFEEKIKEISKNQMEIDELQRQKKLVADKQIEIKTELLSKKPKLQVILTKVKKSDEVLTKKSEKIIEELANYISAAIQHNEKMRCFEAFVGKIIEIVQTFVREKNVTILKNNTATVGNIIELLDNEKKER